MTTISAGALTQQCAITAESLPLYGNDSCRMLSQWQRLHVHSDTSSPGRRLRSGIDACETAWSRMRSLRSSAENSYRCTPWRRGDSPMGGVAQRSPHALTLFTKLTVWLPRGSQAPNCAAGSTDSADQRREDRIPLSPVRHTTRPPRL